MRFAKVRYADKGLAGEAGTDILHLNRLAKLAWQSDFMCKVFAELYSANLCLPVLARPRGLLYATLPQIMKKDILLWALR